LPSGNPKGKNPSDYWEFSAERDFLENPIWDIPNVKAGHPEKTHHPRQFPIELAERCVLALSDPGDFVLDPFVGTGASIIAAIKHGRAGLGIDKDDGFVKLANERIQAFRKGELQIRPAGQLIKRPTANQKVSRMPEEWLANQCSAPSDKTYVSRPEAKAKKQEINPGRKKAAASSTRTRQAR
jgi:hypothetical protein